MRLLRCLLTESDCYRAGKNIAPKGVMIHSTGANNPMLRRYVQPAEGDADFDNLRCELGVNTNRNHSHIDFVCKYYITNTFNFYIMLYTR